MGFIKRIILILFILLSPIGAFACEVQDNNLSNKTLILAPKHIEKDFIKNNTNISDIAVIQNNSDSFKKSQRSNLSGFGGRHFLNSFNSNLDLESVNFQSFLDNKSETIISLLLFQIQPNAP